MQKANIYIDGFNFYNGLVDSDWKKYFWLDIVTFSEEILNSLKGDHKLIKAYYFSAPPHNHESKAKRQARFFKANNQNSKFELVLGFHKDKSKFCNKCNTKISISEEKQTDVNIALYMLGCAVKKDCDLSILVSGDTDMIPIIKAIKEIDPKHQIMVFFPPHRKTNKMINYVDGWRDLFTLESIFKKSLFPHSVKLNMPEPNNITHVDIPDKWKTYTQVSSTTRIIH